MILFEDDNTTIDPLTAEKEKIKDVTVIMDPIVYGFYSIQDGSRIDNREWIHACTNLKNYYRVCWDPEKTINDKLGICTDQSVAERYL